MLLGLAAFAVYSAYASPAQSKTVYMEADRNGRLVKVDHPSSGPVTAPPLWKPEPRVLLGADMPFHLASAQREQIQRIDAAWQIRKSNLLRAMRAAVPNSPGKAESVGSLVADLSPYSELSREYDTARNAAWAQAVALLDDPQKRQLAGGHR